MALWNKKQGAPSSQKVEKQAPRLDMAEIGFTGLNIFSGQIFERFRRKLRNWDEAAKIYIEMRDVSPTIGAMLFAINMLIRQADWPVVPASNDNEDVKAAKFLEENMHDMSNTWEDTVDENLSMFPFGFSFHEVVYKRRLGPDQKDPSKRSRFNDGAIGWRKMPIRAQETIQRWNMDEHGGLHSVEQSAPPTFTTVTIPIVKGLLFRTSVHKGNPEGRSILLNAVRPWFFLKRIEEIEGIGIERDLAGLPVAYIPQQWASAQTGSPEANLKIATEKIVTRIRNDEQGGLVLPSIFDDNGNRLLKFELMSTGGTRQFNTNNVINRYKQDIVTTVLADFILLGQQKVGSFALSASKTEIFSMALNAWMGDIESIYNRFAVPKLFKLNNFKIDKLPKITHTDIESPDLDELGKYISTLSGAGMPLFPDEILENKLRAIGKLPAKEAE